MNQEMKARCVLLAEDDDDFYVFAKKAAEKSGPDFNLERVQDGEQLMNYLHGRDSLGNQADYARPELILLDLNMPKKNGFEVLKDIKANPELSRIPVVMLTVSDNKKDVLHSYFLGANSFVTKPYEFQKLVEIFKIFQKYWFETVQLPSP